MSDILDQEIADETKKPKRKRFYVLLLLLIYFLAGRTFTMFEWPGGSFMIISGMALLGAFFIAELFAWSKNKMQLNILFIACFGLDVYYMLTAFETGLLLKFGLTSFILGFVVFLIPVLRERRDANSSNLDA